MSITEEDDRVTTYQPVVATTDFPAGFAIFDNDDITVLVDGVERTDFTVSATYVQGVSSDARAIFNPGITGDVMIVGLRPPHRQSEFQAGAPLPVEVQNTALNLLQAQAQEARRDINRSLKVAIGASALPEGHFPKADANGNMVDGGDGGDIASAQEYAAAAKSDADRAEAAAATIDLPVPVAATFLRRADDNSAYAAVSTQDVLDELVGDDFTASRALSAPRVLREKLEDIPSVLDWGVLGDGVNDDLASFQNAIDSNSLIIVPPGNYVLDGTLNINDFNVISGLGPYTAGDTTQAASSTARLIFTGTSGACFQPADLTTALLHCGMTNFTIRTTDTVDRIWDFKTVVGFKMAFVRANTSSDATAGFRSVKINPTDNSWVTNWTDVELRLTDASVGYTIDTDMGDSSIIGGASTGGHGAIFRGTGGMKIVGGRYDRSSGAGITISNETESKSQHIISACQIEVNASYGVLVDGDADDSLASTWCTPIITGNHFRNPDAPVDIYLKNLTGPVLNGGTIGPNSHNEAGVVPVSVDRSRWKNVTMLPGNHASASDTAPVAYIGTTFRQSPLVLSAGAVAVNHTGVTTETTLVTISVPANAIGSSGQVHIVTVWSHTNSANSKTMRIRFGGTIFGSVSIGAQASTVMRTEISNRANPASQVGMPANFAGSGSTTTAVATGTVDTTAGQNITITAELASAGEFIKLESYRVEITPTA